jgi:alpha-mannosidase
LAQAGVKYYYACRTGGGFDHEVAGEFPRPRLFWWQAPDGARVLVNREATWYNSYVNIGDNIALPLVDFVKETGLHDWLNVYGIGNHGGGPTRTEIDYLREMRDWPVYPNVVFSTATRWFQTVEKAAGELPVLDHELNFEFTGCYTSQSLIKQANRFGENYLEEAETLAALAARLGGPAYPTERLCEAWIKVLFNQFHDILPGSGVRQTREHAMGLFQEVGAITGSIKRGAGKVLAAGIDTAALLPNTPEADEERRLLDEGAANTPFVAGAGIGAGLTGLSVASGGGKRFRPFVVYNPCAWPRSEMVTVTLYDTDMDPARIVARDETGAQHPTLFLGRGNDWGHDKITVLFPARDMPALGYRTYLLCEGIPDADVPRVQALPGEAFETPFFTLRYDRGRSGLLDLTDKRNNAQVSWPRIWGSDKPLGAWGTWSSGPGA